MMSPDEQDDAADGTLVATVMPADPLRAAFAAAMKTLVEALPPGHTRDIALAARWPSANALQQFENALTDSENAELVARAFARPTGSSPPRR